MYTVLIVDDRENVRISLKRSPHFATQGFKIVGECKNGREALEFLNTTPVDLLMTDVKMPVIDGIELLEEIHNKNLCRCAVVLSNYEDFQFAKKSLTLGAIDYITKPLQEESLSVVLKKAREAIMEQHSREDHLRSLEKIADENTGLSYFRSFEDEIATAIENPGSGLNQLLLQLAGQIDKTCPDDLFKARFLMTGILQNITTQLENRHKWFARLISFQYPFDRRSLQKSDSRDHVDKLFCDRLAFFETIFADYHASGSGSLVQKTMLYVLENPETKLNLKEIAELFSTSPNYLCKIFKQKTGENFTHYITRVKLEHGKTLLDAGILKAYEISNQLGYDDVKYFTRLFKKYTGQTPSEYKKST